MPISYKISLMVPVLVCVAFALSGEVSAEGRCPPGQYPIGGSRAPGCAPIPAGGGGAAEGPRATGRWIKTWGAIATSSTGASGTVTGEVKKSDAAKNAVSECASSGARDCRVSFTYKNQCAAAAVPSSGTPGTSFGSAATEELAKGVATKLCDSRGGRGCDVVYSACTEPKFEAF